MAEEEVVKHLKKGYKVLVDKELSLTHKIKDFLLEIFVIVFAISLSIWFHNLSEHSEQQKETKAFLLGLREDLLHDIQEMNSDKIDYQKQGKLFTYIFKNKLNKPFNRDTLKLYGNQLLNIVSLVPNSGRFEGFKSSGKIGTIENDSLQNEIMDLYQEDIPSLLNNSQFYISNKLKLLDFIEKNRKQITDSTSNILDILSYDESRNISIALRNVNEVLGHYDLCIFKMRSIINRIEKIYSLKSIKK